MGAGNDTFVWDPGDGSDIVEGQDGTDTLLFNGSAGAEIFAASSNGGRLLFTRNVGNIVMDTDDVEVLTLNALGGTDTVTINDLAATDVTNVNIEPRRRRGRRRGGRRGHHQRHRRRGRHEPLRQRRLRDDRPARRVTSRSRTPSRPTTP